MNIERKLTSFYLVRHGETVWNVEQKMQGHKNSPLTQNGIQQVKATGDKLKHITFNHIFSSDLLRARKSAKIIAADTDIAIKTTKLLRESSFGPFEGKKREFYKKSLQKSIAYRQTLSGEEKMNYKIHPDIESHNETTSRVFTFLRETAVAYPGTTILIVTHGGIIRSALVKLGFATNEELPSGSISNAGYIVVESDGIEFFLKETVGIQKVIGPVTT